MRCRGIVLCLLVLPVVFGCGEDAGTRLKTLSLDLEVGSPDEQIAAAEALLEMGEEAVSAAPLLVAILDGEPGVQAVVEAVAQALVAMGEPAVPALSAALRGEIPIARERALAIIRELGPAGAPAVPDLLYLMRGADERVREPAREVLLGLGEAAIPHLLNALNADDWMDRAPAVKCLGELGVVAMKEIPDLLADPVLRKGALDFLLASESCEGLRLRDLVPALEAEDLGVRRYAVDVLLKFDDEWREALELLCAMLGDPDTEVVLAALSTISMEPPYREPHRSEPAARDLAALLTHDDAEVRRAVARALKTIATRPSPEILEALIRAAPDPDARVKSAVLSAICWFGAGRDDCLDLILMGLSDDDLGVRCTCARALTAYGPKAAAAVPALIEALWVRPRVGRFEEYWVSLLREAAFSALQAIGPAAKSAAPMLIELLESKDDKIVEQVVETLVRIKAELPPRPCLSAINRLPGSSWKGWSSSLLEGVLPLALRDQEVMAELAEILSDPAYAYWMVDLAGLLTTAGPAADPLVPLVVDALAADRLSTRLAVEAVSGREQCAAPLLREALSGAAPQTRLDLLYVLWTLKSDEGAFFSEVRKALASEDPELRVTGAHFAATVGPDLADTVPVLIGLLRDDEEYACEEALRALGRMGPAAKPALATLKELAETHEDDWIRDSASDLIKELTGQD